MLDNLQILAAAPVFNVQLVLNGLLIGAVFALAAYGLAVVWGVMSVKNLAQGDFVMLGGYLGYAAEQHGLHPVAAMAPVAALMFVFGWLVYQLVIRRVIQRDLFTSLLATFGLAIVLQQSMNLVFGPEVRIADSGMGTREWFGGVVTVSDVRLLSFALCAALAGALVLFMRRSRMGRAIRATAQDPRAARVLGVNVERVYAFTFALNAAICGAAGVLVAMIWVLQPYYGIAYSVRAFVIVTAAGLGNLPGVIATSLGLGVIEQYSGFVLGAQFQQATVVGLLIVVLVWKQLMLLRHRQALQMTRGALGHLGILAAGAALPFVWPAHTTQIAVLWIMVLFALTWDLMGGQMGYNSLGNILFFGVGMYACAIAQIGMFYDVAEYTAAFGAVKVDFSDAQYFGGLALGLLLAGLVAMVVAAALSWVLFGMRGPYFAIGTLGVALAAAELTGAWDYVGGGGGISMPVFPGDLDTRATLFYALCMALAIACYAFLRWLYGTRFALAINAIRDDEDKAEALGLHTKRYKALAWSASAFFLGVAGGLFGNMTGFIEPLEVAYPTLTFGVLMVAMTLLGGKGTLWGPVLGATLLYSLKELTWTYLLGWQWVALGLLIIVNVVYFQQGILGWLRERRPEWFGVTVGK